MVPVTSWWVHNHTTANCRRFSQYFLRFLSCSLSSCHVCGFQTELNAQFVSHMSLHVDKEQWMFSLCCSVCDYVCMEESDMKNHISTGHAGRDSQRCTSVHRFWVTVTVQPEIAVVSWTLMFCGVSFVSLPRAAFPKMNWIAKHRSWPINNNYFHILQSG